MTKRCYFCLDTNEYPKNTPYYSHYHVCPECSTHVAPLDEINFNYIASKANDPEKFKAEIKEVSAFVRSQQESIFERARTRKQQTEAVKKEARKKNDVSLIQGLRERIEDKVMDQSHIIDAVIPKLLIHSLGTEKRKPLSLFFAGPTGVGKTELTEQIALNLDVPFLKFDMSEYKHSHHLSRLIGSPPSYVGYGRPVALEKLHKNKGVILFDEIEKAHDDVYDVFLQLLDKGVITTGAGKELDLRNCVVVFTSNLGVSEVKAQGKTLGLVSTEEKAEVIYNRAITNHFRPEMINRMDVILFFNSLSQAGLEKILGKFQEDLNDRLLKAHGVNFLITEELKAKILEEGYNPTMGARPLSRTLEKYVMEPVAEKILLEQKENGMMTLGLQEGKAVVLSFEPTTATMNASKTQGELETEDILPSVASLKDDVDFLENKVSFLFERKRKPSH